MAASAGVLGDESLDEVREGPGLARRLGAWLGRDKRAAAALAFIGLACAASVLAPVIAPRDPIAQNLSAYLEAPSARHWLGTDDLGRDVLSRLLYGTRASLLATFLAVGVGLAIGLPVGIVAGSAGKVVDEVLMRVVDAFQSFPSLVLAIGITAMLGPGLWNAMIAIGVTFFPIFARLLRSQTLTVKEQLYVEASRSFGARTTRILLRHVVPNAIQPVVVQVSLLLALALLAESALSFLGFGVQPPAPSWGQMLARAYRYMQQAPLQMLAPGLVIMASALAFNVLGDSLREALDPKSARRLQ